MTTSSGPSRRRTSTRLSTDCCAGRTTTRPSRSISRSSPERLPWKQKKPDSELATSTGYQEVEDRLESLHSELTETLSALDDEDFRAAFTALDSGGEDRA
jgi:hypothetical protein